MGSATGITGRWENRHGSDWESSDDDEVSTPEPKQQRNSEAGGATRTALIATWNCNSAAPAEPDDDEVEFSHVRTADERNAEGFANAEFVG